MSRAWKHLVETLREAGGYRREIPLCIKYKPSETRVRCFVDTAAKALLLLNEVGIDEMGVTLDFGHSMYGNENPAEAVSLLACEREKRLIRGPDPSASPQDDRGRRARTFPNPY